MIFEINLVDVLGLGLFLLFANIFVFAELENYQPWFMRRHRTKIVIVANIAAVSYWFLDQAVYFPVPGAIEKVTLFLGLLLIVAMLISTFLKFEKDTSFEISALAALIGLVWVYFLASIGGYTFPEEEFRLAEFWLFIFLFFAMAMAIRFKNRDVLR